MLLRVSRMLSIVRWHSAMLKLCLPPNVWLHGSQSRKTGGSRSRNGQTWTFACCPASSMRCGLTTPFRSLVEPDVNRILAIVSGPIAALARATSRAVAIRRKRVQPDRAAALLRCDHRTVANLLRRRERRVEHADV